MSRDPRSPIVNTCGWLLLAMLVASCQAEPAPSSTPSTPTTPRDVAPAPEPESVGALLTLELTIANRVAQSPDTRHILVEERRVYAELDLAPGVVSVAYLPLGDERGVQFVIGPITRDRVSGDIDVGRCVVRTDWLINGQGRIAQGCPLDFIRGDSVPRYFVFGTHREEGGRLTLTGASFFNATQWRQRSPSEREVQIDVFDPETFDQRRWQRQGHAFSLHPAKTFSSRVIKKNP